MKKVFHTVIDESAKSFDKIFFSAGKIGLQIEIAVEDIDKIIRVKYEDII